MKFLSLLLILFSTQVSADFEDCKDLYAGAVTTHNGSAGVVLKLGKSSGSGSYTQNFSGWSDADKNSALSLLLAAKLSGHRVNVATVAEGGCSIHSGGKTLRYVQLANNP